MTTKFLATSLFVSLLAVTTAQAGQTITDKGYWPNDVRAQRLNSAGPNDSAYAYVNIPKSSPMMPSAADAWRYQGGPKGR